MPPELLALFAKPELLVAVLVVGAAVGIWLEKTLWRLRRRVRREWRGPRRPQRPSDVSFWPTHPRRPSPAPPQAKVPNAAEQLRLVTGADFTVQRVLNRSEARVYKALTRVVVSADPTWQVMAQVSLGEVLRCEDEAAFRCINSKRVDLLLMDGDCYPRHAIEYQGAGHHQGDAATRDAIKKQALERAGIGYHEVHAGQTTPAELRRLVERLIRRGIEPPEA